MSHEAARGRALIVASSLGFAVMGLVARLLPQISSHEKVFFRSFLGLMLLLIACAVARRPIGRPRNVKGLAWRGIYGGVALICYFYAIDHAGLVKATLYCYTYPVFAAIMGWFELGERPGRATFVALLLALAGTALTLDLRGWMPEFGMADGIALLAGVLSGAAMVSVRKLHQTDTSIWIVISFTTLSSLFAAPQMVASFRFPNAWEASLLFSIAALATASQVIMTSAYRHLSAVEAGVLSLGAVPFSALLGALFLEDELSLRFWVGAALVFSSTVLLTARAARKSRAGEVLPVD
jgi:drug/metabolite transporter (DMT)-like permease